MPVSFSNSGKITFFMGSIAPSSKPPMITLPVPFISVLDAPLAASAAAVVPAALDVPPPELPPPAARNPAATSAPPARAAAAGGEDPGRAERAAGRDAGLNEAAPRDPLLPLLFALHLGPPPV